MPLGHATSTDVPLGQKYPAGHGYPWPCKLSGVPTLGSGIEELPTHAKPAQHVPVTLPSEQNMPGGQGEHCEADWSCSNSPKEPAGHTTGTDVDSGQKCRRGQRAGDEVAPVHTRPAGHGEQVARPVPLAKVPGSHALAKVAAAPQLVPGGHA